MNEFRELDIRLRIPDLWQQKALALMNRGKDVVVDAPTGAGKTYLVELLAASGKRGQIVHTVPTRALANDKFREWRAKGLRVGISTGDVAQDLHAPLVVATLETQKFRVLSENGPDALVIDEYQMLGDEARGVNYELTIVMASEKTQLLLLSGSVSNAREVVDWLRKLGRDAELVSTNDRPVPLEEIHIDALNFNPPARVSGFWPRLISKALMADLGPLLVFCPQRKTVEKLAKQLANQFPQENPLALSPSQKRLAGKQLEKLLSKRTAYHHSGLSYEQRAGLIEPLAKAGQLRIVVSTTGLAAGVNFSMRSVLVTESEYTVDHLQQIISPDELLQMFGRAGRRGMDKVGYALVAPDRPRLREARQRPVKRPPVLDWSSFLSIMDAACQSGKNPFQAAFDISRRLFNAGEGLLGIEGSLRDPEVPCGLIIDSERARYAKPKKVEMLNSRKIWESLPSLSMVEARNVFVQENSQLGPWLSFPEEVRKIGSGALEGRRTRRGKRFGKRITIAYRERGKRNSFALAGWFRRSLAEIRKQSLEKVGKRIEEDAIGSIDLEEARKAIGFGRIRKLKISGKRLMASIDLASHPIEAYLDSFGIGIKNPDTRSAYPAECRSCSVLEKCQTELSERRSPALSWKQLKLIEENGRPTLRGRIFSFFQGGEGLAIAAALEDKSYSVDAIAIDIANLRAGFRFDDHSAYSHRLARSCRLAYGDRSFEGYLKHGLPPQYGYGAAEVVEMLLREPAKAKQIYDESLKPGDVQRARLEWLSLLRHIQACPDLEWDRWLELKNVAGSILEKDDHRLMIEGLPELEPSQSTRIGHRLRFPRNW